ncbi:MAG: 3,4-dihydroxy-2-butanone-4-phosphate synthase [Candidatus Binatus sp.]|uniref:3,4-dihydroxy-2-butanone-4-phosphate synthase n=1 Tax=Candidatus Binatus sp. TaxID=2811406 RepID=UPI0027208C81|nr:3,4-dihydroxy-2-butanone-4-phosphate synthase [Candidatus Binatus sp.]MDO8432510.1 3,4-dihydroxy-2-butanone-4-phosphate synthase [Candidatus Binatus sp.]
MFGEIDPRRKPRAPFISIEEALEETRRGHMIVLMDDEQRENEGDLCMAAEKVTAEAINFMAKFGRGLICLPMSAERIDRLGLSMMVGDNQAPLGTAFTTAITARRAAGSGISAQDRAVTILQAVREDAHGSEFITPGYVYPLRARDGGVLVRTGQTEGAVDLARLAGLKPAGVICEILKDDGTMARRDDLVEFSRQHGLKLVTVADIIEYRLRNETMVHRIAEAKLPTAFGEFSAIVYRNLVDYTEHLVLVMGKIDPGKPTLVRAHREYLPGDVFGYSARNTRSLLRSAMERIAAAGEGVLLYLKRESSGIASDLEEPRSARRSASRSNLQEALFRDYGIGAQILRDVGVRKMIMMSDATPRLANLPGYGLEIVGSVPLSTSTKQGAAAK